MTDLKESEIEMIINFRKDPEKFRMLLEAYELLPAFLLVDYETT